MTAVQRRTQEERTRTTRASLVQATLDLLIERGHGGFTMEDVANRARVTRGALHHHFRSRDELWIAALHEAMGRMDEQLAFPDIASLTLEQRVDLVLDRYWQVFGGPIFVAGLEIRRAGRLNPAIQAEIQREFLRVKETRNAAWAGAFPDTGLPPARLAGVRQLMLDVLRGFALRRITEGPDAVTDEEIAIAKSIIASLLLARPAPAAQRAGPQGPKAGARTAPR